MYRDQTLSESLNAFTAKILERDWSGTEFRIIVKFTQVKKMLTQIELIFNI